MKVRKKYFLMLYFKYNCNLQELLIKSLSLMFLPPVCPELRPPEGEEGPAGVSPVNAVHSAVHRGQCFPCKCKQTSGSPLEIFCNSFSAQTLCSFPHDWLIFHQAEACIYQAQWCLHLPVKTGMGVINALENLKGNTGFWCKCGEGTEK